MEMTKLIERINQLSKISKERELTVDELSERDTLRKKYIKIFRGNLENQLKSVKVIDENGNDVTPSKIKNQKK